MAKDYKEIDFTEDTPCGVHIRYTVDDDDFISYASPITGTVEGDHCARCTWGNFCPRVVVRRMKEELKTKSAAAVDTYGRVCRLEKELEQAKVEYREAQKAADALGAKVAGWSKTF